MALRLTPSQHYLVVLALYSTVALLFPQEFYKCSTEKNSVGDDQLVVEYTHEGYVCLGLLSTRVQMVKSIQINEVSAVFILQWQIWTVLMFHRKPHYQVDKLDFKWWHHFVSEFTEAMLKWVVGSWPNSAYYDRSTMLLYQNMCYFFFAKQQRRWW